MTYVDTSVALAWLLGEGRHPPAGFWAGTLVSSRLIQYELWSRLNARSLGQRCGEGADNLLGRLILVELSPTVLSRALEPFPVPVRTLDALHLSTALYLREQGQRIAVATYDDRLLVAASAVGLALADGIG